jgi:DnaK suppressor protein
MSEELTPEVLEELRASLLDTKSRLKAQLRILDTDERTQGREDTGESRFDEVHDRGEDTADLEEIDRDAATLETLREQLAEVDHALAKFDKGTYGLCEDCNNPIPLARLRVIPWARRDAQHQAEIDARRQS